MQWRSESTTGILSCTQHVDQRPAAFVPLDEVDGESDDGISLQLELPDPKRPADRIAPSTVAGKLDSRRAAAEGVTLCIAVFANLKVLPLACPEQKGPVSELPNLAPEDPPPPHVVAESKGRPPSRKSRSFPAR